MIGIKEIKRISRKARRFSVRNKKNKPAKFSLCTSDHPGTVLYPVIEQVL
jgi:hypothetical protein